MPRKTKVNHLKQAKSTLGVKKLLQSELLRSKKVYIVLALALLIILIMWRPGWFIAASVNGQPITNFELLYKINQQFRKQTLEQLIDERLVMDEVRKNNIIVTESEINQRLSQLENNVGGTQVLDNLLASQGQTRETLRSQLKLQLGIEKLYQNEATVSASEVEAFTDKNKDRLQATDSASQVKEAQQLLKQQKTGEIFRERFQSLKTKAKIKVF